MIITKKICKVWREQKVVDGIFPKAWGKLRNAVGGIALGETGNDWCYTWCLHFENGVLPVVVRYNNMHASVDEGLFEYTNDHSYNGAAYNQSLLQPTWVNVYAQKEGSVITYCRGSTVIEKIGYTQAMSLRTPWNDGVFLQTTEKFNFVITNELLEVYVQGKLIGIWRHG